MKKQTLCLCCILSASLFISASWWQQGDAKISQNISERGYYAATNSVPINTLVDITNPENEKTIRVMVIEGLDDPSFLVTLSREAAEAIALPKTKAKVIMEQLSEEEAYSPFRVAGSPNTTSIKPEAVIKEESASLLAQGTLPLKQALPLSPKEPSQTMEEPAAEPDATPQATSPENESINSDYKPTVPDVAITEDSAMDPTPVWMEPWDPLGITIPETSEATTSNKTDIPVTISETPVTDLDNPETNLPDPISTMADSETLPPAPMDEPELVSAPETEPESTPQGIATGKESPTPEPAPMDEPELVSAPETEPESTPQGIATGKESPTPEPAPMDEPELVSAPETEPESTPQGIATGKESPTPEPAPMDEPELVSAPETEPESTPQSVATGKGTIPPKDGTSEYKLIPAEDRPPEATTFTMLPPESEIAPLPSASLPDSFFETSQNTSEAASDQRSSSITQAVELTKIPDPSLFVEPIDTASLSAVPARGATPEVSLFVEPIDTASRPAAPATRPDPSLFVEPIDTASLSAVPARGATPEASLFVEPIDTASRPAAPATRPDPSLFVEPIATAPLSAAPARGATPEASLFVEPIDTASRPAAPATRPDPSLFVEPITAAPQQMASSLMNTSAFVAPIAVTSQRTSGTALFSIPTITSLEAGQYYLQLIAYNRLEQVESAVSSIGRAYPLSVQTAGPSENPVYRLLIGPLNLGESGALLQRFKGLGYKDAFIRQGS